MLPEFGLDALRMEWETDALREIGDVLLREIILKFDREMMQLPRTKDPANFPTLQTQPDDGAEFYL